MFDVVIVGAGPAGLNAALVLGRAQRDVLLCDTGEPRNAPVRAMHGFLSRDGTDPHELRGIAREQLAQYRSVEVRDVGVKIVRGDAGQFDIELGDLGDTSVPGVYAVGDMARRATMPVAGAMVVIAAAEGAMSGVAIDQELFFESLA